MDRQKYRWKAKNNMFNYIIFLAFIFIQDFINNFNIAIKIIYINGLFTLLIEF